MNYGVPIVPIVSNYMGERRTTFAKAYGIKMRYYGEHVELENTLGTSGTYWESDGNPLRT